MNTQKSQPQSIVKDPYKSLPMSEEQILEFAKCADPITGPQYFMDNYFYIQHPTKGKMLYHPFEYQRKLIDAYHFNRFSISLMPRQTGKCFGINTIVKIKNVHTGVVEEIAIGKFYERFSNFPNLLGGDERTTFSSIQETQYARGQIQRTLSKCANSVPTVTGRKVQEASPSGTSRMLELSESVERKFIESYKVTDYEITTDTGWKPITHLHRTVPYKVWEVETQSGLTLQCADTHILFDDSMNQVFVKDLTVGSYIQTVNGVEKIKHIGESNSIENMFDLTIGDENHRFYSNGILSHNTTSAAGYLLWFAMFRPDSTILIAAHKYTGAQEIMQRVRYAYEMCPDYIRAGATSYNKGSIEFENGSRIVSQTTTETTGRGMSITLLYMDEFAFVRPSIAREFWTSISPTLSTGGSAIITSTPNSDEDQFATIWKQANKTTDEFGNPRADGLGINGFKAYKAEWWEHPDRDEKWKEEEIGRIGEERFRREHGCEFLIDEETLIDSMVLSNLEGKDPIEKQGQVRWYKKPQKGNTYVIGLDPSLGTGGDPAAIQIFELPTMIQVAEWQHNKTPIQRQIAIVKELCEYLHGVLGTQNDIYYSVENNSLGEAALVVIDQVGEQNIKGTFLSQPYKVGQSRAFRKGFTTTNSSKLAVCAKFKNLVENKKLTISSKNLISEMKNYIARGASYSAKIGETDDLVSATLLVIRMVQTLQSYDSALDDKLRDSLDDYVAPMPFIMMGSY